MADVQNALRRALEALIAERDSLDEIIQGIEAALDTPGRPGRKPGRPGRKPGRPAGTGRKRATWSAKSKAEARARMKKYWADRKAAEKKAPKRKAKKSKATSESESSGEV